MFGDKIKALQAKIEAKLTEVETLQTLVEKEDRGFTADESQSRTDAIAEIKALKQRKVDLEETETLVSTKAVPVTPAPSPLSAPAAPAPAYAPAVGGNPTKDADASLFFAKQAHALFVTGGNRYAAAQYAKDVMGDELIAKTFQMPADVVHKATVDAGTSTTVGWAAELVQVNQAASAFIDLLRNESVVAGYPARQMSFGQAGSIVIPRQTGKSAGGWVGEGLAIPVDALAFDDVTLTPKKNACIVVSTNELLRRSDPSAMALIRDDLVLGIAETIDTTFVSPDAESAGVSPAGTQTYDASPTASGGTTLDLITADAKAAIGAMNANNLPQMGRVWLMNPARALSLQMIRDGLGTYAFKDEILSGTWFGYPLIVSNTVPADIVMLQSASNIIIASELAPQISLSQDASLHMSDGPDADIGGGGTATPVASMFQLDMTAIRAMTVLDWGARRAQCVETITGVAW